MKIRCTRHFLKRCIEQNLDPKDISKCLKDEGLMIQGVVKWRLQNGIEIVVNGVGNRLVLITVVGMEKRKRGDIRTKQNLQTGTVICHAN